MLVGRLSENPSKGFTLLGIPEHNNKFIHIHQGPEEIGRIYKPHLGIVANTIAFVSSLNYTLNGLNTKPNSKNESNAIKSNEEDMK